MPISLPSTNPLFESCNRAAAFRGYTVFGIQNGVECWSGPNAADDYNKYGTSTKCRNGLGGPWANDVYRVTIGKVLNSFISFKHILFLVEWFNTRNNILLIHAAFTIKKILK